MALIRWRVFIFEKQRLRTSVLEIAVPSPEAAGKHKDTHYMQNTVR